MRALSVAVVLASSCLAACFSPGDPAPAFSVNTLDGPLTAGSTHLPLIAVAVDFSDPFSLNMWLSQDSLAGFLGRAPPGVSFLFLSYSEDDQAAETKAKWMKLQLTGAAHALRLPTSQYDSLFGRLHFATQPALQVPGWLPHLLVEWQSPRRVLHARFTSSPHAAGTSGGSSSGGGGGSRRAGEALGSPAGNQAGGAEAATAHAHQAPQMQHLEVQQAQQTGQQAQQEREAAARGQAGRVELLTAARLDASYAWIPWPLSGMTAPLAVAGLDCDWLGAPPKRSQPAGGGKGSLGGSSSSRSGHGQPAEPTWGSSLNGSVALITLTAFPSGPATTPLVPAGDVRPIGPAAAGSGGGSKCSYGRMIAAAEAAGAAGVLFVAPAGAELVLVNCSGTAECGLGVGIPATMVSHLVGTVLRDVGQAGDKVQLEFADEQGPGLFAGIDAAGRLFEVGWLKFASLMHAVWAAEWQVYLQRLDARLAEPALTVPIFSGQIMDGEPGLRSTLALPSQRQLAGLDRVELYFQLGCLGANDSSCPVWDHVIQAFVCCENQLPCDPCQPTVWQPSKGQDGAPGSKLSSRDSGRDGSSSSSGSAASVLLPLPTGGGAARSLAAAVEDPPPLLCGREIGRWVTPFRRGVGRHLSDITPLRALLPAGQRCTFTLKSAAWAGPWKPSLTLRFSSSRSSGGGESSDVGGRSSGGGGGGGGGAAKAGSSSPGTRTGGGSDREPGSEGAEELQLQKYQQQQQKAELLLPLPFSGGAFDSAYNSRHLPFSFPTPPGLQRALLVARVTGHGSDENNCAEFCPTAHTLVVNGREFGAAFDDAGTLWGCSDKVLQGVVPNEHGTWALGRNGWCDGQDVRLWVADITAALLSPLAASSSNAGSSGGNSGGKSSGSGSGKHHNVDPGRVVSSSPAGSVDISSSGGGRNNTIKYRGTFRGGTPHPTQQPPGYILMQSNLVLQFRAPS